MPTITTVKAAWEPFVESDPDTWYTDADNRRFDSAMFLGDGSNNGVRGGIVYHGPTSLGVTVNGSDQVVVQPGVAVIPAATGLGVYRVALQTATSAAAGAIDARNATNPRTDLVVIRSTGAIDIITGTPSSSPSAPALPSGAVEIGRLNVPALSAGAVTVNNLFRQYASGLGGTIYVESAARLPGSGNIKGQRAVALDTGLEHKWSGTAWVSEYVTAALGPANGNFTSDSSIDRSGRVVSLDIYVSPVINVPANADALLLPTDSLPAKEKLFWAVDVASGGAVAMRITTGGLVRHVLARTAGAATQGSITYVAKP